MHLAIDMGGSYIRYEIIEDGTRARVESSKISLESLLDSFVKPLNIKKVGISIAGRVRDGFVAFAPNLDLPHKNLAEYIQKRWDVEVVVENDLNMAALAEAKYWGESNLIALYSGTGLGAGVLMDNKLLRGANSLAGEIGHISYKKAPFECGCGKRDCLELYASGVGIKKWAKHYGSEKLLLKEIRESDKFDHIAREYEDALLRASSTLITLFNPSLLVLGGGVIEDNRYLVEFIKKSLPKVTPSYLDCRVEFTRLYDASLEGIKMVLTDNQKLH